MTNNNDAVECSFIWNKNSDTNKPPINHSVLLITKNGVAEGEWKGENWIQYRWSCTVQDNDVLYWTELFNLMIKNNE
jgi:hypothetical protein